MDEEFLLELDNGIRRLAPGGGRFVVAVSGGPDSVAMLVGWRRLLQSRDDQLVVAHFDHGLHDRSAEHLQFVHALAKNLEIPFHSARASDRLSDIPGYSVEEAARKARYAFLCQTAKETGSGFVATAHTADDQAETVLLSIVRGTGIHGLAGMPSSRQLEPGVTLVRPMLEVRRSQVLNFLDHMRQSACADPSNQSLEFTRNRVRRELMPLLREKFNIRVDEALLRLSELARATSHFVTKCAEQLLRRAQLRSAPEEVVLREDLLVEADPGLAADAVRLLFIRQNWPRMRLGYAEVQRVLEMLQLGSTAACDLPDGLRAQVVIGADSRAELWLSRRRA